jgi:hypothetical protein
MPQLRKAGKSGSVPYLSLALAPPRERAICAKRKSVRADLSQNSLTLLLYSE